MVHPHYHTTLVSRVNCVVLTVSDTRSQTTDASGNRICKMLENEQHTVLQRMIVKDDAVAIRAAFEGAMSMQSLHVLITNGGTGIAKRDVSVDTLLPCFDCEMRGFGELFRVLSFKQIGSGAMLSRATAGIKAGKIIFMLPGSSKAVHLAMQDLILPELVHLVNEMNK